MPAGVQTKKNTTRSYEGLGGVIGGEDGDLRRLTDDVCLTDER